jgi:hypothetical protein
MKRFSCVLGVLLGLAVAVPVWSAEPMVAEETTSAPPADVTAAYQPHAGPSVLAALANIVYFPLRFTVTLVTAEAGGLTGWATGGDAGAAQAVWRATDGQAFLRPEVLEGRERLRFGSYE